MALRKSQPAPEAVAPLVPLVEVAWASAPEYPFGGLVARAAELADLARELGMEVLEDWGQRPCLAWDDAARLYQQLTQPRFAPVDPPRRRHIPGTSFADPAYERAEVP